MTQNKGAIIEAMEVMGVLKRIFDGEELILTDNDLLTFIEQALNRLQTEVIDVVDARLVKLAIKDHFISTASEGEFDYGHDEVLSHTAKILTQALEGRDE